MEILKTSIEWAKAEVFHSTFFIIFGIVFVFATIGFWQLGKTEIAKAFIFPTLVVGILLLIVGFGLFFTNKYRIVKFTKDYNNNPSSFLTSEMTRAEKTAKGFQNVFKIIPIIIIIAALLIIFVDKPIWRAIGISTIAMMAVILLIDSNASSRIESYNKQLLSIEKSTNNR